jgi:hypothetical protein
MAPVPARTLFMLVGAFCLCSLFLTGSANAFCLDPQATSVLSVGSSLEAGADPGPTISFYFRDESDVLEVGLNILCNGLKLGQDESAPQNLLFGALRQDTRPKLVRFPDIAFDGSVQERKEVFLGLVQLLSGRRVKVRNCQLLNLVRVAEWFSYDNVVKEAVKAYMQACDFDSTVRKYFLRQHIQRPFKSELVLSPQLLSLVGVAKEHTAILDVAFLPFVASQIQNACSKERILELDWAFDRALHLFRALRLSDSHIADVFITSCPAWGAKFAQPGELLFKGATKTRNEWVQFLLGSLDSAVKTSSLESAIPSFAEHGRWESLQIMLEYVGKVSDADVRHAPSHCLVVLIAL